MLQLIVATFLECVTTLLLTNLNHKSHVLINNTKHHPNGRWDRSGQIVEVLPYRQCKVKINGSGRIVLRNRKFLQPIICNKNKATLLTSPMPVQQCRQNITETPIQLQNLTTEVTPINNPTIVYQNIPSSTSPRVLRRLQSYSNPGLRE